MPLRQFSVCYYLKRFTLKLSTDRVMLVNIIKNICVYLFIKKKLIRKFVNVDVSCKVVLKCFVFNYGYLIYPTNRSLVISHTLKPRFLYFPYRNDSNKCSLILFCFKYLIVWFERFVYIILRISMRVIGH